MNLTNEHKFYIILSAFLLIMVAKKAVQMPISHDEVSTIDISSRPILDILSYKDPIPNNHILNTLTLKAMIKIFGDHPWSDRLPNVLSFILYAFFTVKLSFRLYTQSWVRAAFVLILLTHLFALDFFSVTRGYGMSLALQVASLYYVASWLDNRKPSSLAWALGFSVLGVIASFTLLNFYLPMVGMMALIIWLQPKVVEKNLQFAMVTGASILLVLVCYLPFKRMMASDQFSYWGTNGFFQDTIKPMLVATRCGAEYFGWTNDRVALYLGIGILVLMAGLAFHRKIHRRYIMYIMISFLPLSILYNLLQNYFFQVPFLNPRTALCFVPLVAIWCGYGLLGMYQHKKALGLAMSIATASLVIQHYVRAYNIKSTYEWYYDANTYDVLRDIDDIIAQDNLPIPIKVNCHWIFYPSLSYHIKQKYRDKIILVDYHKDIMPDSDAMFYYTQSDEMERLLPRFNIHKEYSWRSRFLMRAK